MTTNTLFDSENQKSSPSKVFLIVIVFLVVLSAGAFGLWKYTSDTKTKAVADKYSDEKMRDSIVMLLAQPHFSGEQFREQMLGNARLQKFVIKDRETYFSLPESSELDFENSINNFAIDRQKIENAKETDGEFTLGKYSLTKTPETGYFFKTPLENLKFKIERRTQIPFSKCNLHFGLAGIN